MANRREIFPTGREKMATVHQKLVTGHEKMANRREIFPTGHEKMATVRQKLATGREKMANLDEFAASARDKRVDLLDFVVESGDFPAVTTLP